MELLNQKIGSGGSAKLEFTGGKLIISGSYDEGAVAGSMSLAVSSDALINEIEKKLPGIPAQLLELLKVGLKAL